MSLGAARRRGLSLNASLNGALLAGALLASSLLVAGLSAGCGSNAASCAQRGAADPQPASSAPGQLDSATTSQLVVAEPTRPQDAPAVATAQPTSPAPEPPEPPDAPDTAEGRRAELRAMDSAPRHVPSALTEPARPSRLKPGIYRCSVGDGYKLRECRVETDAAGRTLLEIGDGNLVAARGVVWDDGASSRFEGWLTDRRPFGCFSCQDRCYIEPGSCVCDTAPLAVARACIAQPVSIVLSGAGNQFKGKLSYSHFYATYEGVGGARHLVPGQTAQSFPVRLLFQKPLPGCGAAGSPCGKDPSEPNRGGALDARH